ncbi:MAG: hypothetical protein AB1629_05640 [Candidatus Omnitrophota bacterium]
MELKKKKPSTNYKRVLKKAIKCGLYLLFILFIPKISFAQNNDFLPQSFIDKLSNYFLWYYSSVQAGKIIKPKSQVLKDIGKIALRHCPIDKKLIDNEAGFDNLSILLNEYLGEYGKAINIFTISDSEVVSCWLGDLVEESAGKRNIWGKEIEFLVKVIDSLEIKDSVYYLSKGKEALEVGVRDNVIYYNLETYKLRANSLWEFFASRITENKNRRYDPSKSDRLRKQLYYKSWFKLYSDCIKDSQNLEVSKSRFINQAIDLLKENSLFHEIGHIFADKYLKLNDETKEEALAFLSELRYGPLPYDSLDMVISARYKNPISNYKFAGDKIITDFIFYINNEQRKNVPDYKKIKIQGKDEIQQMRNLFKLTEEQIRSISENIFRQEIGGI